MHELAAAKIEESEKLRRALGIRKDYEEGSHWKRSGNGIGATEERLKAGLKNEDEDRGEKSRRRRSGSGSAREEEDDDEE